MEAEKVGLITKVIPHDRLREETDKRIKEIAELPLKVIFLNYPYFLIVVHETV